MYAIIETGGKQYRVAQGDEIQIEKLPGEEGDSVTIDRVLAITADGKTSFGAPTLDGASVTGTITAQGKHKKVIIFKYLPKKDFRKKKGHRQPFTSVRIDSINL
ncbi:50S ribosomal protein L21 [Guggenheimella bovis]